MNNQTRSRRSRKRFIRVLDELRKIEGDHEAVLGLLRQTVKGSVEGTRLQDDIKAEKLNENRDIVIDDPKFKEAILRNRRVLGLPDDTCEFEPASESFGSVFDDDYDKDELVKMIAFCDEGSKPDDDGLWDFDPLCCLLDSERNIIEEKIDEAVEDVKRSCNLHSGWDRIIMGHLTSDYIEEHRTIDVYPNSDFVRVEDVDSDSVCIRFHKGMKREDYISCWDGLREFLSFDVKKPKEDSLNNKIYMDRVRGMTHREIAQKYFSKEYEDDPDGAIEIVKKRIKRLRAKHVRR